MPLELTIVMLGIVGVSQSVVIWLVARVSGETAAQIRHAADSALSLAQMAVTAAHQGQREATGDTLETLRQTIENQNATIKAVNDQLVARDAQSDRILAESDRWDRVVPVPGRGVELDTVDENDLVGDPIG